MCDMVFHTTQPIIIILPSINILCLECGSVRIVRKMKLDNMKALLKQEIGFFEQGDASSGGLASSVSAHPANVGGVTGLVSTQSIVILVTLLGALAMGLALDWRTAIVGLPLILVLFVAVSQFFLRDYSKSALIQQMTDRAG